MIGDGRANVDAVVDLGFEVLGDAMAPRVERDDLAPARSIAETGRSSTTGEVSVRSGRAIGLSAPEETASAR